MYNWQTHSDRAGNWIQQKSIESQTKTLKVIEEMNSTLDV